MSKRYFFNGTMNASKSANLLMQLYNLKKQGKKCLVLKPKRDTRDGEYVISRALSTKVKADILVDNYTDLYETIKNIDCQFLFVDESHFFLVKHMDELLRLSLEFGITVYCYGLMVSYTGDIFATSRRMIELGFSLKEIKMQCDYCVNKSTNHLLYLHGNVILDGDPIFVGDEEFKSVCISCFKKETQK